MIRTDHSNGGHLTDDQVTNKTLKRAARKNLVHRVIYLDLPSVVTVNVWLVTACPAFVNCTPATRKAASHLRSSEDWVWRNECFPRNEESLVHLNCACVTYNSSLWHAWFRTKSSCTCIYGVFSWHPVSLARSSARCGFQA